MVSWDDASFELVNMTEGSATMESVCVPIRPGHVLMPNLRNFSAHHSLCKKFHGITSVIHSQETQDALTGELMKYPACFQIGAAFIKPRMHKQVLTMSNPFLCPASDIRYWNGWWDEPNEGTYTNVNTGEELAKDAFQPWYMGEPNGKNMENCAIVWARRNFWNDQGCEFKMCGFCELEKAPDIVIRGSHRYSR